MAGFKAESVIEKNRRVLVRLGKIGRRFGSYMAWKRNYLRVGFISVKNI